MHQTGTQGIWEGHRLQKANKFYNHRVADAHSLRHGNNNRAAFQMPSIGHAPQVLKAIGGGVCVLGRRALRPQTGYK